MYFQDPGTAGLPMPAGEEGYQAGVTVDPADDTASHGTDIYDTNIYDTDGTYDTDGDGRHDTVLITGPSGSPVLLTDIDGDGAVDVATEITSAGRITVSEHAGDGRWIVVERSQLGSDTPVTQADLPEQADSPVRADDASAGFASSGPDSVGASSGPVVSVDPATGEWVEGSSASITTGWPSPARPVAHQG